MTPDQIVEEVRAVRERLAAEFGFDIGRIIADARRRQATSGAAVVSFEGQTVAAVADGGESADPHERQP
jgi:hypothetical protein